MDLLMDSDDFIVPFFEPKVKETEIFDTKVVWTRTGATLIDTDDADLAMDIVNAITFSLTFISEKTACPCKRSHLSTYCGENDGSISIGLKSHANLISFSKDWIRGLLHQFFLASVRNADTIDYLSDFADEVIRSIRKDEYYMHSEMHYLHVSEEYTASFLIAWSRIEAYLKEFKDDDERKVSRIIATLKKTSKRAPFEHCGEFLTFDMLCEMDRLRDKRNNVIHRGEKVSEKESEIAIILSDKVALFPMFFEDQLDAEFYKNITRTIDAQYVGPTAETVERMVNVYLKEKGFARDHSNL